MITATTADSGTTAENGLPSKKRRLRIAMVCDFFHPRLGGVENHIWNLSQQLLQAGHKVIVITHAYPSTDSISYHGVRYFTNMLKVYYCPIVPMTDQDSLPTFTATLPLMRNIFLRESIDLIHAHQATSVLANEAVVYGGMLKIPTVYTDHSLFCFHDVAGVVLNRVISTTLATVDAAIAVSQACRDNLALRANLELERLTIIPNAVDADAFVPDPSQRNTDRITVVVVSRLVYRKGVDLLKGIIPRVCHNYEKVDFLIAGAGNRELALREMLESERLEDRVTLLGAVPHASVRNVLVRGDIFLNCSLTESFCIAILEAACSGLLVVSTNVGGIPEVLPGDEAVLLAEPSVPDMIRQLDAAIKRAQTGNFPAHERHLRVRNRYSWYKVVQGTMEVYNHVLHQPRRSFYERMECYLSLGGLSGFVACCLALIIQLWFVIVELWQPEHAVDRLHDEPVSRADGKKNA